MYIHTSQSQLTVIVSLKLNTHTYRLREDKLLGSTILDGPCVERPLVTRNHFLRILGDQAVYLV